LELGAFELRLQSNTPGYFLTPEGEQEAFHEPLSTGQILLLFSDIVPKPLTQTMLSGHSTTFCHATPQGHAQCELQLLDNNVVVHIRLEPNPRMEEMASGEEDVLIEEGSPSEETAPEKKDCPWSKLQTILDKAYAQQASQVIFQPDKKPRLRMGARLETEQNLWPLEDFLVIDNQLRQVTQSEPPMDQWKIQRFDDNQNPTLVFNLSTPHQLPLPEEVFLWTQRKSGLLLLGAPKISVSIAMLQTLCHRLAHENNFCMLLIESGWYKPLHESQSTLVSISPQPLPTFAFVEEGNFDVVVFEDLGEPSQMHLATKLAAQNRLVLGALMAQSSAEMLHGLPMQFLPMQHLFHMQLISGCFQPENAEAELFQPSHEWHAPPPTYEPQMSTQTHVQQNSAEAISFFELPTPEIQTSPPPKRKPRSPRSEANLLALEELVNIT
jgi:hypothetical protein